MPRCLAAMVILINTHTHTHYSFNHAFAKWVKGLCCAIGGGICVKGLINLPWGRGQVRIPRWWSASVVVSACVGLSTGRYLPRSYRDGSCDILSSGNRTTT